MPSPQPTLIVPVESQVRELDAKLLLACTAAERGFSAVIGSRDRVDARVADLPRGIYLAKSLTARSLSLFGILRHLGHEIVAWDEEALVRYADEDHYRRRLHRRALRKVSDLFAWGDADARVLRAFSGYDGTPIHVTGNPRVDLMRPELRPVFAAEVRAIRERCGRFVLLNTNFPFVNAFLESRNVMRPAADPAKAKPGSNAAGMTAAFARGVAAHKQALFDHFIRAIPRLAKALPTHALVVRPHPAERKEPWLAACEGLENVHVMNDSNVLPWLLAADVLVHNGCTTAVEAAVMEVPAVAYQPVTSEAYDLDLPNSLSRCAFDLEELDAAVKAAVAGGLEPADDPARRKLLGLHIASLDGALACDRIVDLLVDVEAGRKRPNALRVATGRVVARGRGLKRGVNERRRGHRNSVAFQQHRFPGVTVARLVERIDEFGAQLGRFAALEVRELAPSVFCIEAARAKPG